MNPISPCPTWLLEEPAHGVPDEEIASDGGHDEETVSIFPLFAVYTLSPEDRRKIPYRLREIAKVALSSIFIRSITLDSGTFSAPSLDPRIAKRLFLRQFQHWRLKLHELENHQLNFGNIKQHHRYDLLLIHTRIALHLLRESQNNAEGYILDQLRRLEFHSQEVLLDPLGLFTLPNHLSDSECSQLKYRQKRLAATALHPSFTQYIAFGQMNIISKSDIPPRPRLCPSYSQDEFQRKLTCWREWIKKENPGCPTFELLRQSPHYPSLLVTIRTALSILNECYEDRITNEGDAEAYLRSIATK